MLCQEIPDALTARQWETLARWLGVDLAELMAMTARDLLFVLVVGRLNKKMFGGDVAGLLVRIAGKIEP